LRAKPNKNSFLFGFAELKYQEYENRYTIIKNEGTQVLMDYLGLIR